MSQALERLQRIRIEREHVFIGAGCIVTLLSAYWVLSSLSTQNDTSRKKLLKPTQTGPTRLRRGIQNERNAMDLSTLEPQVKEIVDYTLRRQNISEEIATAFTRLELPVFQQQVDHVVETVRLAKNPGQTLVLEGTRQIGKGSALKRYVVAESKIRPAIFVSLRKALQQRQDGTYPSFKDVVFEAFGYSQPEEPIPEVDTTDYPAHLREHLLSPFRHLTLALSYLTSHNVLHHQPKQSTFSFHRINLIQPKPPLLVIDDVQLLVDASTAGTVAASVLATDRYGQDLPMVMEWLIDMESELGVLEVVLCSSDRSVLRALRKRIPGAQSSTLGVADVGAADDHDVVEYLLQDVNPTLFPGRQKFTPASARKFVSYFSGNLQEIHDYVQSKETVDHYIQRRTQSTVNEFRTVVTSDKTTSGGPPSLPSEEEVERREVIKSLILELIMGGGSCLLKRSDSTISMINDNESGRREAIEWLVEKDFLRFKSQDGDASESEEDDQNTPVPVKVVWANRLSQVTCERFFNDEFETWA